MTARHDLTSIGGRHVGINTIADPTFNLNRRALAALQLLRDRDPHWAEYNREWRAYVGDIETFPWFNGRERGFALVYHATSRSSYPVQVIVCAENRTSDQLFVDTWVADEYFMNGVSVDDMPDEAYEHRKCFKTIESAVVFICQLMETFYNRRKKAELDAEAAAADDPFAIGES